MEELFNMQSVINYEGLASKFDKTEQHINVSIGKGKRNLFENAIVIFSFLELVFK